MKTTLMLAALALGVGAPVFAAQDSAAPAPAPASPQAVCPVTGQPRPRAFRAQALPPGLCARLNLTAEQRKQIDALNADVQAKLATILTPDQLAQLKSMPPPRRFMRGPDCPRGPRGQGWRDGRGGPGCPAMPPPPPPED